jgi:PadR family transcriptional regulator, regulatory protein PadR
VPFATAFQTVSVKLEFVPDRMAQWGFAPVAGYTPANETSQRDTTLTRDYPLALITPAKTRSRIVNRLNVAIEVLDTQWSTVYHASWIEGRTSSMEKTQQRMGLLQGTLDMLILRTLLYGPAHGHQIGKHIQRSTNDLLQMQHGSLYPALHRLERKGWVISKWQTAPDRNREFKYYRLTDKGKKQLVVEESQWRQMAEAVARVMWPAVEES